MTAELESVTKKDLVRWLDSEGFAGSTYLTDRLLECWVIHYIPHCGCDHHGDPEGCDPSCECSCKFEIRKIR